VALSTWPLDLTILKGHAIPCVIRMHRKSKSIVSDSATWYRTPKLATQCGRAHSGSVERSRQIHVNGVSQGCKIFVTRQLWVGSCDYNRQRGSNLARARGSPWGQERILPPLERASGCPWLNPIAGVMPQSADLSLFEEVV